MSSLSFRPEHPALRLSFALLLAMASACGSADDGDSADEPTSPEPTSPEPGGAPSAPPANGPAPAPSNDDAEAAAMVAAVLERAGDQLGAACGPTFDACEATEGCDEILACAARSACSGVACYCADASCATPGPCRSVIDGAPGARTPDADNPSLGPASDAAAAVGACLQGLAGGFTNPAPTPDAPAPDAPAPDAPEPQPSDDGSSPSDAG
jgi:hypothetical protein